MLNLIDFCFRLEFSRLPSSQQDFVQFYKFKSKLTSGQILWTEYLTAHLGGYLFPNLING